ncbi:hypothetical protein BDR07DRAFT_1613825 [Suillus spraguei]|nr:hypothetical protein BDR07DRAFT_1613825 [Suillus spraguei]
MISRIIRLNAILEQADDDGPKGAEARKQIGLWKTQITNSQNASDPTVFNDLFDQIDTCAKEVFEHVHTDIGEKTDTYLDALSGYRHNVVKLLRTKWLEGSNDAIEDDHIMRQYDRITARVTVWLSPHDDTVTGNAPIPLLSAWLLDYAWSSLDTVKEGIIEICRWFEPLLEYYPVVRGKSHEMDDKSEVMINNFVVNHVVKIYAPDADLQLCHFLWERRSTLIFHLHNTMSTISEQEAQQDRPKDIVQIDTAFDKLPRDEKQAFMKLIASMKKASKCGLRYSIQGSGAYAMHVTKWDWQNKTLKNQKRDIEPLVKAVFLELRKVRQYRAVILADSIIAGLRKQLERFHDQIDDEFVTSKTWRWWDDIEIPKDVTPFMSAGMDKNFKSKLQQIQLEQQDQDAITELVTYVEHMVCARATTAKDSALNSEVVKTLNALVYALKANSTCLHNSSIAGDPELSCDFKATIHPEIPKTKDQVDANTTLEPQISGPSSKRQRSSTNSDFPNARKKRARNSLSLSSVISISDDEDVVG